MTEIQLNIAKKAIITYNISKKIKQAIIFQRDTYDYTKYIY